MHSALFFAAGLATLAQAFTQPGAHTWGPLLAPDTSSSVTQGKDFTVTWDPESHPTDGVTVSLVLCHGPGSNCVLSGSAIAEGLPASQKSFDWKVPCDLAPGVQSTSTGYGMLIIVDGTGEFQYSTQFSVLASSACSGSSGAPSGLSSVLSSVSGTATITASGGSSIVLGPPAYQTGSQGSSSWGNWSTAAAPTGSSTWTDLPGTTVIVSTSGSMTYTYYGGSTTATGVSTAVVGATTFSTVPASTTVAGASTTGPATPTFTGGVAQLGSSIAGIVVAGAVAVLAF